MLNVFNILLTGDSFYVKAMARAYYHSMLDVENQGLEVNNLDFNSINTECGVNPFFSTNTVLGFVFNHRWFLR